MVGLEADRTRTAHAPVDQAFCGRATWVGLQVLDQELRAEFA